MKKSEPNLPTKLICGVPHVRTACLICREPVWSVNEKTICQDCLRPLRTPLGGGTPFASDPGSERRYNDG